MFNSFFGNDFFELTLQICTEEDVYVQRLGFASQNLLRLRRKTRFARLSPPADSHAFGARYSRFALVAYFSQTVLNRVFDKDYLKCKAISPTNLSLYVEGVKLSSTLNAQLSFHVNPSPHGMRLTFLFTSKCIAKLYLSPRILPHLGKYLSFLPPNTLMYMWLSLTTGGRSQAFFLKVHPFPPSPPSKCNATLPHKSPPIYL